MQHEKMDEGDVGSGEKLRRSDEFLKHRIWDGLGGMKTSQKRECDSISLS
jgi:UDP-3-O-acyl-N-acetylglucosamine deacetylase